MLIYPELKLEPKPNKTKKAGTICCEKLFDISAYKKYLKEVWRENFTNLWQNTSPNTQCIAR